MILVAISISPAFNDPDGVVELFDDADIERMAAAADWGLIYETVDDAR